MDEEKGEKKIEQKSRGSELELVCLNEGINLMKYISIKYMNFFFI